MRNSDMFQEFDSEKVEEKSKNFLKSIMGNEIFNKFVEKGKVEIQSDDNIYELYDNGKIINKTTQQSYCIVVPNGLDLPIYDTVAIKYAYLKNGVKTIEKVANKTSLHSITGGITYGDFIRDMEQRGWQRQNIDIRQNIHIGGYAEYVDYLLNRGWRRELISIDENNTNLVSLHNVQRGHTGTVVDIRCPAGRKMSIMGTQQIPQNADPSIAYPLSICLTDENEEEISPQTKIRITKVKPSEEVIQLARIFYSDISTMTLMGGEIDEEKNGETFKRHKNSRELYRFLHGIELNGEEHFIIHAIDTDKDIIASNNKFRMDLDIWTRLM